ncbi:MAG: hypothetical protein QW097_00040 [archaeon]
MGWKEDLPKAIVLCLLVFVMLYLLVKFGWLAPGDIPGFCGVYYAIEGQPNIAIVYGEDGTGDPEALRNLIAETTHKFPTLIPLDNVYSSQVLEPYALVIVDRAKKIDTAKLYAFKDYVVKGKKLVWIGDAGTELGENDYICKKITWRYLPAFEVRLGMEYKCSMISSEGDRKNCEEGACEQITDPSNKQICLLAKLQKESGTSGTQVICSQEWFEEIPTVPKDFKEKNVGICGRSFAEIVLKFIEFNQSIYESVNKSPVTLCPTEKEPFRIEGAESIIACLETLKKENKPLTLNSIKETCVYSFTGTYQYALNPWNRGPSKTPGGIVEGLDFSFILGMDYVSDYYAKGASGIWFEPVDMNHPLLAGTGYEAKTQYAGEAHFGIVNIERFSHRSSSVLNLRISGKVYPGIVVSNPSGPSPLKRGNVIYIAYPPEELAGETKAGSNLLYNIIKYSTC